MRFYAEELAEKRASPGLDPSERPHSPERPYSCWWRVGADRQNWNVDDELPTCEVPDKPEMKIQAIFAIYLV